jgi:hypothetical protein
MTAVSTIPKRGTEILAKIIGPAICHILWWVTGILSGCLSILSDGKSRVSLRDFFIKKI